MKHIYIQLATAKLAKEEGFDQQPYRAADNGYKAYYPVHTDGSGIQLNGALFNLEHVIAMAPTQAQLQAYIREERGVHIIIDRNACGYYWSMCMSNGGTDLGWSEEEGPNDCGVWDTYEEALEHAMQIQLTWKLPEDLSVIKHWGNYVLHALAQDKLNKLKEHETTNN